MKIENRIAECYTLGTRQRSLNDIKCVMVHRIEIDGCEDAASIAKWFKAHPEELGLEVGVMPYTIIIKRNGEIEQALKLTDKTPHAVGYNTSGLAIGCIGNFDKAPMPGVQRVALESMARWLEQAFRQSCEVIGHTERLGTSRDPSKHCPGRYFNMPELRDDVLSMARDEARQILLEADLVFV